MIGALARLLSRPSLDEAERARLAAWRRQPADNLHRDFGSARYVVVDVESTGLDLNRDRLIAIGAVAVTNGQIDLSDGFEVVLRQERVSDRENILVHGIGGESQREGMPPAEALLAFLEYLGNSPLVAFHVTFDETLIRKACQEYLGLNFRHPWVDLAYVMPALLPEQARHCRSLDDWTQRFGIPNHARHNAVADALATSQLLLCALPLARQARSDCYRHLAALEKAQRWVKWAN